MSNSNKPIGTPLAEYADGSHGPFKCGNCIHFKNGHCGHPVVNRDPRVPKDAAGAKVDSNGCCKYFHD